MQWSVPRLWPGRTVTVAASGPSLSPESLAVVREKTPLLAVNNAVALAPWADALFASDARWWRHYADLHRDFEGIKIGGPNVTDPSVFRMYYLRRDAEAYFEGPWSQDSRFLPTGGGNSGYQAVNIALLAGARRVLLLGFDMHYPAGQKHFFGDHEGIPNAPENIVARWADWFNRSPPPEGVEIINCTPGSAVTIYPSMDIPDAIGLSDGPRGSSGDRGERSELPARD